ncbi:MAG: protein-L-isoaspartate O-methyltransferase [Gammaproteobacteria bacterium]|nr:protein-L-isoaspartate O-methyltransferase [Gammaproteobacteria bacterium]
MNAESARHQMVKQQVRAWEVLDPRVLEVLGTLHREAFVPEQFKPLAFADTEIPLPHKQFMMAPKVEGRLLQALDLSGDESVLEIGTGSGFLTACLARLARQVNSVEIHADMSSTAARVLDEQGIRNANLEVADALAIEIGKTYDAIAVTASSPRRIQRFEKALRPGGRLFIIVGEPPAMEAMLVTRVGESSWTRESLFETSTSPLLNVEQPSRFKF